MAVSWPKFVFFPIHFLNFFSLLTDILLCVFVSYPTWRVCSGHFCQQSAVPRLPYIVCYWHLISKPVTFPEVSSAPVTWTITQEKAITSQLLACSPSNYCVIKEAVHFCINQALPGPAGSWVNVGDQFLQQCALSAGRTHSRSNLSQLLTTNDGDFGRYASLRNLSKHWQRRGCKQITTWRCASEQSINMSEACLLVAVLSSN